MTWVSPEWRSAPSQLPHVGRCAPQVVIDLRALAFMHFEAANSRRHENLDTSTGDIVIIFGLIFLVIGFVTGITIVWTIGVIVLVVGLVLWLLGSVGHAIGGRRHYY